MFDKAYCDSIRLTVQPFVKMEALLRLRTLLEKMRGPEPVAAVPRLSNDVKSPTSTGNYDNNKKTIRQGVLAAGAVRLATGKSEHGKVPSDRQDASHQINFEDARRASDPRRAKKRRKEGSEQ
jgi:hypothetical protein